MGLLNIDIMILDVSDPTIESSKTGTLLVIDSSIPAERFDDPIYQILAVHPDVSEELTYQIGSDSPIVVNNITG